MGQSLFDTITYDQVIGYTKQELGITNTTDHDALLEIKINEAVRHIDNLRQTKLLNCILDITDNRIALPKGFQQLLGLRFCELASTEDNAVPSTTYMFRDLWYFDYKYLNMCDINPSDLKKWNAEDYINTFKIVENKYIVFNFNAAENYSKAQIAFKGVNTDTNGKFVIYADYERAVVNYAAYQFALRFPELYSSAFLSDKRETWKAQKAWLKGRDQERAWSDNKAEMQKVIHTMFIDLYA